ncbi:MAG: helix-hairpin-helix domain-containing protein, partial [Candidatus Omnitrophota bacterium]
MNTLESLVSLNLIPQIGSVRLEALLKYFNQPEAVFQASREDLSAVVGEKIAQGIRSFDRKLLKKDLTLAEKANLKITTLFDEDY